jgi:hypothetical protein
MKSVLGTVFGLALAFTLEGCAVESGSYTVSDASYGESTPGILYTPNYDYYTRYDDYPTISGGSFYSYGGRYEGGGYGYGAPFNH